MRGDVCLDEGKLPSSSASKRGKPRLTAPTLVVVGECSQDKGDRQKSSTTWHIGIISVSILLLISSAVCADNLASSQCGPATAVHVSAAPTTGLCAAGTASSVSGAGIGPWRWSCNGGDGTSASCFAISGLPVTDDFTSDSILQPELWQPFAANGESIKVQSTSAGVALSLYVPGGTDNHSATTPNNSTHLMQKIDNRDFYVETNFTSKVSQPLQGQGLIVQQDDANFIRLGIYTTGCQAYIYGVSFENGVPFTFLEEPVENGSNLYLRISQSRGRVPPGGV